MIELFQDKRLFLKNKRIQNPVPLPQIKFSPIIARKLNDKQGQKFNQKLLQKNGQKNIPMQKFAQQFIHSQHSRVFYHCQPLSNILISKKIVTYPQDRTVIRGNIKRESTRHLNDSHKSTSHSNRNAQINDYQHKEVLKQLTFLLSRGNNNEDIIKDILLARKVWRQINEGIPNLKWVFYKERLNYKKPPMQKRIVNHFQFNDEICTKDHLVRNLQLYCQTKQLEVFTITPVTFIIDFDDEYCEYNMRQFIAYFMKNDPRKKRSSLNLISQFQPYMSWQNSDIKKKVNILSRPVNSSSYFGEDSYLWLLKPTGLNRGRGIQLFDSLQQLQASLLKYLESMKRSYKSSPGKIQNKSFLHKQFKKRDKLTVQVKNNNIKQIQQKVKLQEFANLSESILPQILVIDERDFSLNSSQQSMKNDQEIKNQFISSTLTPTTQAEKIKPVQTIKLNSCSFVIQKYVEKPFLIQKRKFDIRVWALLTSQYRVYFFKEGYIRTSAETYSTNDINNYFIHLTNNAIQKHSQHYGQYESGNQLSFKQLKDFLSEGQVNTIWNKIKQISFMCFSSVKKKINLHQRKNCFQLFGLDFIIDYAAKVWLIQVNQNPCLQCSSPLLQQLIPRMIDNAFKLTLDCNFDRKIQQKAYPVDGYSDKQNLWENLGQLTPNGQYQHK